MSSVASVQAVTPLTDSMNTVWEAPSSATKSVGPKLVMIDCWMSIGTCHRPNRLQRGNRNIVI